MKFLKRFVLLFFVAGLTSCSIDEIAKTTESPKGQQIVVFMGDEILYVNKDF